MENITIKSVIPPTSPISDCCVCLQICLHPVELPCKHIFCFLCIKGAAYHNQGQCPLCRQPLPQNYLAQPKLIKNELIKNDIAENEEEEEFNWYYEGKNGWWKYDERTNMEIEKHFQNNEKVFELLIAGLIYIINIEAMVQCQRANPARCRQIKRDKVIADVKGTAGLSKRRLQYMKCSPKNEEAVKNCDNKKDAISNNEKSNLGNSKDVVSTKIGTVKSSNSLSLNSSVTKNNNILKPYNLSRHQYYYNLLHEDEDDDSDDLESDDKDSSFNHSGSKNLPLFLREVVGSSADSENPTSKFINSQPLYFNAIEKNDADKIYCNTNIYEKKESADVITSKKNNIKYYATIKPTIVKELTSNLKENSNVPSTSGVVKSYKSGTNTQMFNDLPKKKKVPTATLR